MIGSLLGSIFSFFSRIMLTSIRFIGQLLGYLFQKLFDFLKLLLMPVLIVVAILFYFLYKLMQLVLTLLAVLLGIGKLFFAFVKGIFATLAGFSWTPTTRNDGQWTSIFSHVVSDGLGVFQIDTIAYILLFMVWFATGFAAIRILSSMRGDDE